MHQLRFTNHPALWFCFKGTGRNWEGLKSYSKTASEQKLKGLLFQFYIVQTRRLLRQIQTLLRLKEPWKILVSNVYL